ncbi:MAG: bifunctional folylpolyglutamate synthase/dihydrofolate synthase [Clostridia bacterium]|nr:bifunctional folylpolyglutamate synthase/dihydrofolate synthase [Clostridia bacterium]
MDYNEALCYIETAGLSGSRPGLERITELCRLIGDPQDKVRFVHVAGTNGKGSVCAMLSEILKSAGYKAGLFTSPHLCFFEERIKIDGAPISKERLADITGKIKACADKMRDKPTEFEIAAAMAFLYFYEENCDIAVLETGLGGRLDATNIIKSPLLSVITGIDLDHTAVLGDTVEKIAAEKGGIIKAGCPVVLAACGEEAKKVLTGIAKEKNAPLYNTDYERKENVSVSLGGTKFTFKPYGKMELSLSGVYQADNACTAVTAAEALNENGFKINAKSVKGGLENARWQARFEVLGHDPVTVYDGAHNPQGALALKANLDALCINKAVFLTGVMADKDYSAFAKTLSPLMARVFTVKPKNPRALDGDALTNVFIKLGVNAVPCKTVSDGVRAAVNAAKKENLPLIICGSLYMYGEVKNTADELFQKGDKK